MLKKIKLPEYLQGWLNKNRIPFRQEVYESTIYPTKTIFGESHIYCEECDRIVIKNIIKNFKKNVSN